MITASTNLYCVLGNPVSHSQSPVVHNSAFKDKGVDGIYLAFEPESIELAVQSIRTMKIKGASITIPFKEDIIKYLDWIDPMAKRIGAVNTIVNLEGKLSGFNTDCKAAVAPLLPHGIEGKLVCIVGAGGAARAAAYGIEKEGGKLVIVNRDKEKARILATELNGDFVPFEDMESIGADVVINATSLGMHPHVKTLSFTEKNLQPGMVVMDMVYTPLETRLLMAAREKGCIAIDGLSMFVSQAAAQFELWTGLAPDIQKMKKAVLDVQPPKEK